MAQQLIDVGDRAGDKTGDKGRDAFIKVNENTTELYATRAQVKHTVVNAARYTITDAELVLGHNIFGVNRAGPVTITLPINIDSNKLITVNDESGQAGANNITLQVNTLLPPTNFAIDSFTDTTATVSWTPSAQGTATAYAIYANGSPVSLFVFGTASPVLVTGLKPDTLHTMYMITLDAIGQSEPSNTGTVTTEP